MAFDDYPSPTNLRNRASSAGLWSSIALVIIFTVSSITIIPIVYWSVGGLGVAYAQLVRDRLKTEQMLIQQD